MSASCFGNARATARHLLGLGAVEGDHTALLESISSFSHSPWVDMAITSRKQNFNNEERSGKDLSLSRGIYGC